MQDIHLFVPKLFIKHPPMYMLAIWKMEPCSETQDIQNAALLLPWAQIGWWDEQGKIKLGQGDSP